jgi:hypothetical protein
VLALAAVTFAGAGSANAHGTDSRLAPRTHFTMQADGSSGVRAGGEGIPNVDSVKKTIYAYYGDPAGTGQANPTSSPYISELAGILARQRRELPGLLADAQRHHQKPAIVFDADDTTLWTYQMEVGDMKFVFTPAAQAPWVDGERFPATPGMVDFVNHAQSMGFTVFGLTGRSDSQKAHTVSNLAKSATRRSPRTGSSPSTTRAPPRRATSPARPLRPAPRSSTRRAPASTSSATSVTASCSTWATSGPTCRVGMPTGH